MVVYIQNFKQAGSV